jgi:hypothetical protein
MTSRGWPISHVESSRSFGASILIFVALLLSPQLALAQFTQQGPKLVGRGASATAQQGHSVALSGDGNQAMVGGPGDFYSMGAAWSYRRSNGVWTQQGDNIAPTAAARERRLAPRLAALGGLSGVIWTITGSASHGLHGSEHARTAWLRD